MARKKSSMNAFGRTLAFVVAAVATSACASTPSATGLASASEALANATVSNEQKKQAILAALREAQETGRAYAGTQVNEREVYIDCDSADRLAQMVGHEPAILGLEIGHSGVYPAYDDLVFEHAVEHSRGGGIVTLTWHAPNPLKDCPLGQEYACSLDRMTDEEFNRMVTPGTREHAQWLEDVAALARFLKRLEDAGVVVLFRPFHEMNGRWFWWGQREQYPALWESLFDRLEGAYGLTNLIRVWAANGDARDAAPYFPTAYLPAAVGSDVYRTLTGGPKYEDAYRNVSSLAPDALFTFGEVGHVPDPSVMALAKPAWVLVWGREFLNEEWGEPSPSNKRFNTVQETTAFFNSDEVAKLDDLPMASREIIAGGEVVSPERPVCPLTWLPKKK